MDTPDARVWTTPTLTHMSVTLDTAGAKIGSSSDGTLPGKLVV